MYDEATVRANYYFDVVVWSIGVGFIFMKVITLSMPEAGPLKISEKIKNLLGRYIK